jgi:uncharacterized protein involved in exopolysaccharide biosynthesis
MNQNPVTALEVQDPLVDNAVLLGGYAVRAVRRRFVLASVAFVATMLTVAAFLAMMSPAYEVETRILIGDTQVMKDLAQPVRMATLRDEPEGTAGAAELITSRETLGWVIDSIDLPTVWQETRRPVGRVIDRAVATVFGPMSPQDRRDALIEILQERITVVAEADVITFTVEWHEPKTALILAETLKNRFLAVRQDAELDQIVKTRAILEQEAQAAFAALGIAEKAFKVAADEANALSARALRNNKNNVDLEQVARMEHELTKKREAITRLEASLDARIADAEARLNAARSSLGAGHPDVVEAQRHLALQSREPEPLAQLRADEERLSRKIAQTVPGLIAAQLFGVLAATTGMEPELETALTNYRRASEQYSRLAERLQGARIELDTAAASFDFRYVVTQPPVLPRQQAKPNVPAVALAGLAGGAFLAFVLAVLADALSRRVQEPWQITRFLGVPVLGQLEETT